MSLESPEAALAREIREELGCTVSVGGRVVTTEHEYDFAVIGRSFSGPVLRGRHVDQLGRTVQGHREGYCIDTLDEHRWAGGVGAGLAVFAEPNCLAVDG